MVFKLFGCLFSGLMLLGCSEAESHVMKGVEAMALRACAGYGGVDKILNYKHQYYIQAYTFGDRHSHTSTEVLHVQCKYAEMTVTK